MTDIKSGETPTSPDDKFRRRLWPLIVAAIALLLLFAVVIPSFKYAKACALYESRDYAGAEAIFRKLENFRDSEDKTDL